MLSERVLEAFVRRVPMSEHLVAAAWPDLSTEGKLQVVQGVMDNTMGDVPDWLLRLAMGERIAIVRYWAANSAYLRRPRDPDAPVYEPLEKLFPGPSEEESI